MTAVYLAIERIILRWERTQLPTGWWIFITAPAAMYLWFLIGGAIYRAVRAVLGT